MQLTLTPAAAQDEELWNGIVDRSPHSSIFHLWRWLDITARHTKTTFHPLIGMVDEEPLCIVPLFVQKRGPVRFVFSPPPHAAIFGLGPLVAGWDEMLQDRRESVFEALVLETDRYIRTVLRAGYIHIALPYGFDDPRPFTWLGYSVEPAYDYSNDLSEGFEAVVAVMGRKSRQDLARAARRGITVGEGGRIEMEKVIDLMVERYREQKKMVTVSKEYLLELYDVFPGNIRVLVARQEDEIVTGLLDLHWKDRISSWIGNPKPHRRISPSPNDLIAYEALKISCATGFSEYITMSAAGNSRLHHYYASKFNPGLKVRYIVRSVPPSLRALEMVYTRLVKPVLTAVRER
ncbi:MAG: GNAT family N-acetyltransferase [Methanomicrobiaceae archaeon]|nr:GNAT family N-acetyltransferase [Methanomicrobiaceae archaeon]